MKKYAVNLYVLILQWWTHLKRNFCRLSDSGLELHQIYNADETGLYWRVLPDSTQASKVDKSVPGRKKNKERLSAVLCANAEGNHCTKPAIVGKAMNPRAQINCRTALPVHYYATAINNNFGIED
jgi:hypothetical protein